MFSQHHTIPRYMFRQATFAFQVVLLHFVYRLLAQMCMLCHCHNISLTFIFLVCIATNSVVFCHFGIMTSDAKGMHFTL